MTITASELCKAAAEIVSGDRQESYGDAFSNHQNIADLWNAYLGCRGLIRIPLMVTARDVAMLLCLLKIARTTLGHGTLDNFIDLAGYAAIAGEIAQREKEQ